MILTINRLQKISTTVKKNVIPMALKTTKTVYAQRKPHHHFRRHHRLADLRSVLQATPGEDFSESDVGAC
jgi:hypothetical protein